MMSPQHAKAMLRHLAEGVQAYEGKFGEIKIPEALIQQSVEINFQSGTDR